MSRVLIEANDDKKDNTKVVAKREEVIPVPEDHSSRSGSEKESLTKISIFTSIFSSPSPPPPPSPLPLTEDETRIDSHRRIRRSLAPSPDSQFEMKDDISSNMEDHLSILAQKTQTQVSKLKYEQYKQQHEIREGLMNVVSSRNLEMAREETETEDPNEESQPLDSAPEDTYQDRPSDGESETSTHTSLSSLPPTTNRDQNASRWGDVRGRVRGEGEGGVELGLQLRLRLRLRLRCLVHYPLSSRSNPIYPLDHEHPIPSYPILSTLDNFHRVDNTRTIAPRRRIKHPVPLLPIPIPLTFLRL